MLAGAERVRAMRSEERHRVMDAGCMTVELSVEDLMRVWPETIRVFLCRRMACVGCAAAAFHTVEEVARIYDTPPDLLLAELREIAGARADHGAVAARRITPRQPGAPGRAGRGSRSAAVPP